MLMMKNPNGLKVQDYPMLPTLDSKDRLFSMNMNCSSLMDIQTSFSNWFVSLMSLLVIGKNWSKSWTFQGLEQSWLSFQKSLQVVQKSESHTCSFLLNTLEH